MQANACMTCQPPAGQQHPEDAAEAAELLATLSDIHVTEQSGTHAFLGWLEVHNTVRGQLTTKGVTP